MFLKVVNLQPFVTFEDKSKVLHLVNLLDCRQLSIRSLARLMIRMTFYELAA